MKAQKEKKKSQQNQKRNQKDFTPATGVNTTDNSKQSCNRPTKSNAANIICYCCNKKGHYAKNCTKSKN